MVLPGEAPPGGGVGFRFEKEFHTMRQLLGVLAMFVGVVAMPALAAETKFNLSGENTKIGFVGTKPDGKHVGGFKTLMGTATVDKDPTTLKIEVEIDMDSTYTDEKKLTLHLKSPDFFGVKTHPRAKFVTTRVEKGTDGYTVTGDLTLAGKTKSITFPARIATGDGLTLDSSFKINRHDFGISYGKGKIDDDVSLTVKVKASK
jgi:polyisoprenoid-binding protein YceI